jgi:hypothetical protein
MPNAHLEQLHDVLAFVPTSLHRSLVSTACTVCPSGCAHECLQTCYVVSMLVDTS